MKIRTIIAALTLTSLLASHAFATNNQQSKMVDCNKQAENKKGNARDAFMKNCLSSTVTTASTSMSQKDKAKICNAQAGDRKGDARTTFMKTCLSNKG